MSIGNRIREARKSVKMTQAQLAKKVGMAQATLSELETGESDGTTMIASFAVALGVNAFWLETGRGLPGLDHTPVIQPERAAKLILAYDDEAALLDDYRRTDDRGRITVAMVASVERARVEGS